MSQTTHAPTVTDPAASDQPLRKHTGVDQDTTTTTTTTTTDGNYVDVKSTTDSHDTRSDAFDARIDQRIKNAEDKRQAIEDVRANKRNFNRMMTLLGAILIGLVVVWTLPRLGHVGAVLSPYSFVITVLCDAAITVYAYFRHY